MIIASSINAGSALQGSPLRHYSSPQKPSASSPPHRGRRLVGAASSCHRQKLTSLFLAFTLEMFVSTPERRRSIVLRCSTGCSLCLSGSASGNTFERSAGRSFIKCLTGLVHSRTSRKNRSRWTNSRQQASLDSLASKPYDSLLFSAQHS